MASLFSAMSDTSAISPRLAHLAAHPEKITVKRLWNALPASDREAAAIAFLSSDQSQKARRGATKLIADQRHFRPQTVATWPADKMAAWVAKLEVTDDGWAWNAIIALHTGPRAGMVAGFLDDAGIPHEGASIADGWSPDEPVAASTLIRAADGLVARHPLVDVVVYLAALHLQNGDTFRHAADWMDRRVQSSPAPVRAPQAPVEAPTVAPPPVDTIGFTTLDRRLTRIIVDCVAEIDGAPTVDEVDDILNEMEKLNGTRHQTFFHLGYRDALFGREPASALAASNEARRRWYWSGYVAGIARAGDFARILALYGAYPELRDVLAKPDGASGTSGWIIVKALCDSGRFAEAAALLSADVVSLSLDLRKTVLATATALIRKSRAADAKALLGVLWDARDDDDDENLFWLEVKRRQALCLRQLGEHHEAKLLLQELAEDEDAVTRAIAHTDLGLLATGRRRLGEFALPASKDELANFIESVRQGEELFHRALGLQEFRPAHAQFALGVLDLARKNYTDARNRLDQALSFFSRAPDVYTSDGSLALAQLDLGLSICLAMDDTGRLQSACELIRSGLDGGAKVPAWLAQDAIDSLSSGRSDLVMDTAARILAANEATLDALIESAAGRCTPAISSALFARAGNASRPVSERVKDYRRALPLVLRDGSGRASDALEFLEIHAIEGIGAAEFVELLQGMKNYDPAWSLDRATEALARTLEAQGRYSEAAAHLETMCYRLMARSESFALDNAELLIGHLESFGESCQDVFSRLAATLDAKRATSDVDTVGEMDGVPVRILIVGGNEVQARMDESIVKRVASEMPGVSVDFLHSGWGTWDAYADEFTRRVRAVDGVVMLQLMRTTLGWTIRQNCAVPWRGCRGRGQGQIVEAIRRVVPFARRHLTACRVTV
jgi:tetratricopeptide (TPR) repeat protein